MNDTRLYLETQKICDQIGERIKSARERAGLKRIQLAKSVNRQWHEVCRVEEGQRLIDGLTAVEFAKTLNMSVGEMIGMPYNTEHPKRYTGGKAKFTMQPLDLYMKKNGITQAELGRRTATSAQQFRHSIGLKRAPLLSTLIRWCIGTGIYIGDFFTEEPNDKG